MSTVVNITDRKIDNAPVFGQLAVGQWFMFEGELFCKTPEMLSGTVTDHYNAFTPACGFEYIDLSDPVELVEEINIHIIR